MAGEAEYGLSATDRGLLQSLLAAYRRNRLPMAPAAPPSEPRDYDPPAPEVYLVYTPPGGIPAGALLGTGTGLPGGITTGTGTTDTGDDSFGSAVCRVFHPVGEDANPIWKGQSVRVYNVGTLPIDGSSWVIAVREKWGKWLALMPAVTTGGSGGGQGGGTGQELCGWLSGLTTEDCLEYEITAAHGLCSTIPIPQVGTLSSASATTWTGPGTTATGTGTDDTFTTALLTGQLTFSKPEGSDPSLSLTDGTTTYTFDYRGCVGGKAVFSGGGPKVCPDLTGTGVAAADACNNYFLVTVSCVPCYYTVQTACAAHEIPSVLYAHLVLTATGCGFDVNVTLTYGAVPDLTTGWAATFTAGGCQWSFGVQCVSSTEWTWLLRNEETATGDGGPTTAVTYDPELTLSDSQGASVLGFGETCCTYGGGGITIAFDVTE